MALSGPDNLGAFRRRRHKKLPFPGLASGRRPFSLVNSNPYISTYSSPPVNWELPDTKHVFTGEGWVPIPSPSNWPDPGLWAGDERVWRGITIPQTPRKIEEPTVPKEKGPTKEERAEAWKQAMEDMPGPMQGDTIPGVPPGGGSRDHQASTYGMGIDFEQNNPIADTDLVRKRLYGLMGFGR